MVVEVWWLQAGKRWKGNGVADSNAAKSKRKKYKVKRKKIK